MSFIIIPFIASLILIVIYDKLESIPSVKKANYQPWSPPPTPGSHSPTSTTATETSDNSSQPMPLFSVSDKQQSTPVHSISPIAIIFTLLNIATKMKSGMMAYRVMNMTTIYGDMKTVLQMAQIVRNRI